MDLNQIAFKATQHISGIKYLYASTIIDAIRYTLHKLDLQLESNDFEQVHDKVKENLKLIGFANEL